MQDVNGLGPLAACDFIEKKLWSKKANFPGKISIFLQNRIKISTFQDAGHSLNGASDMSYSKLFTRDYDNWIGLLVA